MRVRGIKAFSETVRLLLTSVLASTIFVTATATATSLFDSEEPVTIQLTGPLSKFDKKAGDRTEVPFTLSASGNDHAVKVRLRGKSRLRVCKFAPLRINFTKRDTGGTEFDGIDKVKLVTQCKDNSRSQQDLFEEYAAYRLFNEISDISYQVRLARIEYIDTAASSSSQTAVRNGFFIEPDESLAKRIGAEELETTSLTLGSLDLQQAARVFVFQYLIGNTDWSLVMADLDDRCCHNLDLFERDGELLLVPYDFDLAGLVNARYAKPDPSVGIGKVTARRYRGYCITDGPVAESVADFVERKNQVIDTFRTTPGLSEKTVATGVRYLERFYKEAANQEKIVKKFKKRCL